MDFIVNLPKSEGCRTLMVVVDRFSKYATFVPATKDCPAEEAAKLFLKHVVKYWGVPQTIVSDRDPRFTGRFWTELFKLLGSDLNFSTSLHSQTEGANGAGQCTLGVIPPTLREYDTSELGEVDRRRPVLLQSSEERIHESKSL